MLYVPPFYGFADILHRDEQVRLSLSTSFSMDQSTWNTSNGITNEEPRRGCSIHVTEIEARSDASESTKNLLEIHEIRLNMGPSSKTFLSRGITAHNQSPSLRSICVSDSTTTQEYSVTVSAGYPQFLVWSHCESGRDGDSTTNLCRLRYCRS